MTQDKANAIGINHVALEVGDIEEALAFYGRFVNFTLRSKGEHMAVIDLGDQFISLSQSSERVKDNHRHFGLVVDDREAVQRALEEMGVEMPSGRFLDFYDPWGNRVQIVTYQDIQFTKAPHVLRGMGLKGLEKTDAAKRELARKGMEPPAS